VPTSCPHNVHYGIFHHANRLLTGWSLVRIRPGEPPKIKHLAAFREAAHTPKNGVWQHSWQQRAKFADAAGMTFSVTAGQRFSRLVVVDRVPFARLR